MCSPDIPAPPDYTDQMNAALGGAMSTNRQRADQWNADVSAFNSMVSQGGDLYNNATGFADTVGGLTIADLWDDPGTDENENPFGNLRLEGRTLSDELAFLAPSNMSSGPDFIDSVAGQFGMATVNSFPTYETYDTTPYNMLRSRVGTSLSDLEDLRDQRMAEERRVTDWRNNFGAQLAGLDTRFGQLGIENLSGINQLETDLSSLNAGLGAFSSPIMEQLGGFDQFGGRIEGLNSQIAGLRSERQAELDRVRAFEEGLLGQADTMYDALDDLTIADVDDINTYRGQLEDALRSANRFQSPVGYDLSQEMNELMSLDSRFGNLLMDRAREQDRIGNARQNFSSALLGLESGLGGASIYSKAALDGYGEQLANLRAGVEGFSSELPTDFGLDFTGAEGSLSDLYARRQAAIDPIMAAIAESSAGIDDLALYDTTGRDAIAQALLGARGDLSQFRGGRADEGRTMLEDYLAQIEGQRDALSERRGDIATRSSDFFNETGELDLMTGDDVAARRALLQALQDEASLYGASSATPWLNDTLGILNSRTNAIQADQAAIEARNAAAQNVAEQALGNSDVVEMLRASNLSDEEIMQILASIEDASPEELAQYGGNFSALIGAA